MGVLLDWVGGGARINHSASCDIIFTNDSLDQEVIVDIKKLGVIFVHALAGWALWITIIILFSLWPINSAIISPLIFSVVAWIYYKKFNHTAPFLTAVLITAFVILDFCVFVLLRGGALIYVFSQYWLTYSLIFGSVFLTGLLANKDTDTQSHKFGVIAVSTIASALGSGVFGFFIDVWFWGMYENAVFGAYTGFGAGLIAGIVCSIIFLRKGYSGGKVFGYSLLAALLISGLLTVVFTFMIAGPPGY